MIGSHDLVCMMYSVAGGPTMLTLQVICIVKFLHVDFICADRTDINYVAESTFISNQICVRSRKTQYMPKYRRP